MNIPQTEKKRRAKIRDYLQHRRPTKHVTSKTAHVREALSVSSFIIS
jgi:hypothetical protein